MHRNRWHFILPAAALLMAALVVGCAAFAARLTLHGWPARPRGQHPDH